MVYLEQYCIIQSFDYTYTRVCLYVYMVYGEEWNNE